MGNCSSKAKLLPPNAEVLPDRRLPGCSALLEKCSGLVPHSTVGQEPPSGRSLVRQRPPHARLSKRDLRNYCRQMTWKRIPLTHVGSGTWFFGKRRWIAAGIFVALLGVFVSWVHGVGKICRVYLVNGTSRPYTVAIQGREYSLAPGEATLMSIAKGAVEVAFPDANLALAPVRCMIDTSSDRTLVINPDQAAVMLQQQKWYAPKDPPPCGPSQIHAGKVFYDLPRLNYEFRDFPKTIHEPGSGAKSKTGISLLGQMPLEGRLGMLLPQIAPSEHVSFFERLLQFESGDDMRLRWLAGKLTREETLAHLKAHSDWHSTYQSLMERTHPDTDLRPRYQKLLADSQGNAGAAYLLARIEPDPDRADQLLRQAATGQPPSGHAMMSLGDTALSNGRFAEAVDWYEMSMPLVSKNGRASLRFHDALLANRDYDRLLERLETQKQRTGNSSTALLGISRIYAIMGDKVKARTALAEWVQHAGAEQSEDDDEWKLSKTELNTRLCCWENDRAGYLKGAETVGRVSFEVAFLRGNLETAAEIVKQYGTTSHYALLYLAAERSGAKDLALAQWQTLTERMARASREERLLADILLGRKPITECPPQKIPLDPRLKRVYLAVIAQRHPELAMEAIALAEKLDFHRDEISLCLRKVMTDGPR
jgi:hypothetical protein